MMRVALGEVVARTVDLLDLLFVEEELAEVVFVVYLVALVSVGFLVVLLCYP